MGFELEDVPNRHPREKKLHENEETLASTLGTREKNGGNNPSKKRVEAFPH